MRRVVSPKGMRCAHRVRVLPARENNAALPALPGRQVAVEAAGLPRRTGLQVRFMPHAPPVQPRKSRPVRRPNPRLSIEPLIKCFESI